MEQSRRNGAHGCSIGTVSKIQSFSEIWPTTSVLTISQFGVLLSESCLITTRLAIC